MASKTKEKLIIVSPFSILNSNDGGKRRIENIFHGFTGRNDTILLYPSAIEKTDTNQSMQSYKVGNLKSRSSRIFSFKLYKRLNHNVGEGNYKRILFMFPWNALQAMLIKLTTGAKIYYDAHNHETTRIWSTHKKSNIISRIFLTILTAVLEYIMISISTNVFVVSQDDRDLFVRAPFNSKKKYIVAANGYDSNSFKINLKSRSGICKKHGINNSKVILGFVGSFDYQPNLEAIDVIEENLGHLTERYHLLIVGKKSEDLSLRNEKITVAGTVDDIAQYYQAFDAMIVPLLSGGGTRLKILECIGCGTKVLSTKKGAEGIKFANQNMILKTYRTTQELFDSLDSIEYNYEKFVPNDFSKRYGWDSVVDIMYEKIIN